MFITLRNAILTLFGDMQSTFLWIFAIGLLICSLGAWAGDEQYSPRFKSGIKVCIIGLVVFLLARPIVQYIDSLL